MIFAYVLGVLLTVFFVVLGCSTLWMLHTWPYLKADELIYQLSAPLVGTGHDMLAHYAKEAALPAAAITVLLLIFLFRKKKEGLKKRLLLCLAASFVLCMGIVLFAADRVNLTSYYLKRNAMKGFVEEHFADPDQVAITFPEQKKNLIYIYMESMEPTYADRNSGGAFDVNYIENLTRIAQENEDFSGSTHKINGAYSLSGSTFTMGAIFTQSMGLPLLLPGFSVDRSRYKDWFFPHVTGIGDILEENGYENIYLVGSDATFGGRRAFFESHGNFRILDTLYLKEKEYIPEDYHEFWGMEDEKLFAYAREELERLTAEEREEPFNLTILTVDTHFEDGYVCRLCEDTYDERYANVIVCQDRQVSGFIQWLQEQPFYEDTTVVVVGDHPTMDSDFCKTIDPSFDRRAFVAILNGPETSRREARVYTTMDLFPTTLAALGAEIEGERLGLGTNLYAGKDTLAEEFGRDGLQNSILSDALFLMRREKAAQDLPPSGVDNQGKCHP
ncbi:MAG: LTA synthase family protein [Lachnospiraceae bacterium]|nr:LTA synthase family protein [Lachnospiraceae bacterium]